MKSGLEAFQGIVTPADFPTDSFAGRLKLVAVGVLITLVTQSSSAGVHPSSFTLSDEDRIRRWKNCDRLMACLFPVR